MTSTGEGGPESSGPDDETTRRRRVEQVADSMRETAGLLGDAARSHDLAMLRLESVVSPEGAVQRLIDAIGNAATELSSLRGLLAVGGQ
ncbi:MAG TPA: hypothetical protein VIR03_03420, partial [Candidatus Saccharimonadales bacterium]